MAMAEGTIQEVNLRRGMFIVAIDDKHSVRT